MVRSIFLGFVLLMLLGVVDEVFNEQGDASTVRRHRMYKFLIYQDVFVGLCILKLVIFERYTLHGVLHQLRSGGVLGYMYVVTTAVLHGSLLLHEDTDHMRRLNPMPYTPETLNQEQKELFLL